MQLQIRNKHMEMTTRQKQIFETVHTSLAVLMWVLTFVYLISGEFGFMFFWTLGWAFVNTWRVHSLSKQIKKEQIKPEEQVPSLTMEEVDRIFWDNDRVLAIELGIEAPKEDVQADRIMYRPSQEEIEIARDTKIKSKKLKEYEARKQNAAKKARRLNLKETADIIWEHPTTTEHPHGVIVYHQPKHDKKRCPCSECKTVEHFVANYYTGTHNVETCPCSECESYRVQQYLKNHVHINDYH